ncbi:hypothetical protein BKA70DRAFT_1307917 [Coprinopsis sp. MPI-PUGE-AT-0042]|nr:hypothetical protein BKA70DRAFT_1307917 [Coprinopsis sp. MPI-PUGE-AT-0042]
MASSCKATSSIALDEIWRSRRSMVQLLGPLHCDGFISESTPKLSLRRVLTDKDAAWTRFCEYAARIRVLTASESFFEPIHHGTILQLMKLTGSQPMFPRLESLNLSVDEKGTIASDLPLFVSPRLSNVDIEVNSDKHDAPISAHLVDVFLSMMGEQGAPLEHLSLVAKIPVSISSFFSTLSHSKTLLVLHLEGVQCLDAYETSWVVDLGRLDRLQDLRLVVEEDTSGRLPLPRFTPPSAPVSEATDHEEDEQITAKTLPGPPELNIFMPYSSLERLDLRGPASVLDALLSCVASRKLEDLTLNPQAPKTTKDETDLCGCFDILREKTHLCGSVKRFTFEADYRPDPVIHSGWFEPIRKLKHLEYLEIRNPMTETQTFIQSAMTQLRSLEECIISLQSTPADVTAFHMLAMSCPKLTRLQLPINTSNFAVEASWFTPKKHRLEHLLLSPWEESQPSHQQLFLAVRHLNAAFPYLRVLEGGRCWQTVSTMLATLQDLSQGG